MELARRRDRVWAKVIDNVIFAAAGILAALLIPGLKDSSLLMPAMGLLGAVLLGFFAYQIWLLTTQGQTLGKKIMGVRIVKTSDMSNGGFVTNVLLRALASAAVTLVPIFGALFAMADPLFIFREDRRCLHDHIAGTCVIKA
ncbi:MAG: RDD family protein [Elusimicrobiota bacterium]|nr:RDD family protein [Elusimicrobiota bacterium]